MIAFLRKIQALVDVNSRSNINRGFDVPLFLQKRRITANDSTHLQTLFSYGNISYFSDLTPELLRSYLKVNYSEAYKCIRMLGLYGVQFFSEKLRKFSEPANSTISLIASPEDDIAVSLAQEEEALSDYYTLSKYLRDEKISTNFILNGMRLEVISFATSIPMSSLEKLFDPFLYTITRGSALENFYSNKECLSKPKEFMEETHPISLHEDISIDAIEISVRSYNVLKNNKIDTLQKLMQFSDAELMRFPNFGRRSLQELREIKEKYSDKSFLDTFLPKEVVPIKQNQEVPSYFANLDLASLSFSTRTNNVFNECDIKTVRDLLPLNEIDLLRIKNFGRKSLREINDFFISKRIKWGEPYEIIKCEPPKEEENNLENLAKNINDFENSELKEAHRLIYNNRIKSLKPSTLQELGYVLGVSRERIRQIEKKIKKMLLKKISKYLSIWKDIFCKYGLIVHYTTIPEFEYFQDIIGIMKNLSYRNDEFIFDVDIENGFFLHRDMDLSEIITPAPLNDESVHISEISRGLDDVLSPYVYLGDEEILENYNQVHKFFLNNILDDNYVSVGNECYVIKNYGSANSDKLSFAFKKLFPDGVYIHQDEVEIFQKINSGIPDLNCSSPRALKARLNGLDEIIMVSRGLYKHIDTIEYSKEAVAFAVSCCKAYFNEGKKMIPVDVLYNDYHEYFSINSINDPYLLYSLIKRERNAALRLTKLMICRSDIDDTSKMSDFERFFDDKNYIVSTNEVKKLFLQEYKSYNLAQSSQYVFSTADGYFSTKSLAYDENALQAISVAVNKKLDNSDFVNLENIRKDNAITWHKVLGKDISPKTMGVIMQAFIKDFPYNINSWGKIFKNEADNTKGVVLQWADKRCKQKGWFLMAELNDFCEKNSLASHNQRTAISPHIKEIHDDCYITNAFLGIDEDFLDAVKSSIHNFMFTISDPYISLDNIIENISLPALKDDKRWTPRLLSSILSGLGDFSLFNLIIINKNQDKITNIDHVIASEIKKFKQDWQIPFDTLEKLLGRLELIRRDEKLHHKIIQERIFHPTSCIELRDMNKIIAIKQEFRDSY